MSSSLTHPLEFFAPGWHGEERTPVVDDKYYDRVTGEIRSSRGVDHAEYSGPPAVDMVITSQHEDTTQCVFRAMRPFPMEALLCHALKVVGRKKLGLDSVMATEFAIRIRLSHALTPDEFSGIALEMVNGIWEDVEELASERENGEETV